MKQNFMPLKVLLFVLLSTVILKSTLFTCSTFIFERSGQLIFAHNLDQPGIKVPGYVIVNKRGIYKKGKSESELFAKNNIIPARLDWISKYGSITFNVCGKDMIDGGMNEAGLYIWEMSNVQAQNVKEKSIHKLYAPNWMQYILDNFRNVEEVIGNIQHVVPEGMTWHYFCADKGGNCAIIDFADGKAVVYEKKDMPVPGLFNRPYSQELKRLECFKGFGGHYKVSLNDRNIPRMVLTAKMLRDYKLSTPAITHTFNILSALGGGKSDWSVVFDVIEQKVYFRTDVSPEIKYFSTKKIDYSNETPVLFLDIDLKKGGDVIDKFSVLKKENHISMIKLMPLPESMKTSGGLTVQEFDERWAENYLKSYPIQLKGTWVAEISVSNKLFRQFYPGLLQDDNLIMEIKADKDAVFMYLSNRKGQFKQITGNNISLINNSLSVTFMINSKLFQIKSRILEEKMAAKLLLDGLDLENLEFFRTK